MQLKLDTIADALYIKLNRGKVSRTENKEGYLVDYDKKGKLVGFEVLNFSKTVPKAGERKTLSEFIVDRRSLAKT